MEQNTSKTTTNILIILAIIIISVSVFSSLSKKSMNKEKEISLPVKETPVNEIQKEIVSTSTITTTTIVSPLTAKTWTWFKSTTKGKNITPKKATAFTITFTSDKNIKGTTDCNSFFGTYKDEMSQITFGPFGSTRMYCEASQEQIFLSDIQNVSAFSFDKDGNLILTTASGTLFFK